MKRFALSVVLIGASTIAFAQDAVDVIFIQAQLEDHGFDLGSKPDGKIGPRTKAALSSYAERYNVSADFSSVRNEMLRRNAVSRVPILDEKLLQGIKERVGEELNDPFSAQFKNIYKIGAANGSTLICGEVNAKNLYGAYVGFRFFYGLSSGFTPIMLLRVDGENALAESACLLSHPR
jgi:peptidoglycan hydrolase-like protein with peptidoglycan-binding domain